MVNANAVHEGLVERPHAAHRSSDDELIAQIEMLPDSEEVSAVVGQLDIDDLREFAASIMNAAVDSIRRGHADLETVRLLNGWFASMEETIAAGEDIEEILSRRRKRRDSNAK